MFRVWPPQAPIPPQREKAGAIHYVRLDSERPQKAPQPRPPYAPAKADALRNTDRPQPRPPAGPNGQNGGNTPGRPRPGGGLGWVSRILLLLLIAIVIYNVVVVFFNPANVTNPQVELSYSDFLGQIEATISRT